MLKTLQELKKKKRMIYTFFIKTSLVSKRNEWYFDFLFFLSYCLANCHCLWNHYCHFKCCGHHLGLEHQFQPDTAPCIYVWQYTYRNLSLPLSHGLPGCLLHHLSLSYSILWTWLLHRTLLLLHSQYVSIESWRLRAQPGWLFRKNLIEFSIRLYNYITNGHLLICELMI